MTRLHCVVLVQEYPDANAPYRMMFVHTRLLAYREVFDVTVLSMTARDEYHHEGIRVLPASVNALRETPDVLVVHAPLKPHLDLLKGFGGPLVVFLHGHEALDRTRYYPRPYSWQRLRRLAWTWKPLRDVVKLRRLRRFLLENASRTQVITVSDWMREHAQRSLGFPEAPPFKVSVIPNPVHPAFERNAYDWDAPKPFDFVCIRRFDEPKYGVDLFLQAAREHPDLKFLVVGEGEFFSHVKPPPNLEIRRGFLPPERVPAVLDHARCAFLATRQDTQGVLACEVAQYGMPLLTSDLRVCREMLGEYPGVMFEDNEHIASRARRRLQGISRFERVIDTRYSLAVCTAREIACIREHIDVAEGDK